MCILAIASWIEQEAKVEWGKIDREKRKQERMDMEGRQKIFRWKDGCGNNRL